MADSSRLTVAAYLIRELVQLRITEFEWPEMLGLPVFDFEASIVLNGKTFVGRGVHPNRSTALDKAIAESFERSLGLLIQNKPAFGGLAVHTDIHSATEAAKLELIERDAFFCHFLTSTPFQETNLIQESELGQRLLFAAQKFGITVKDYVLSTPEGFSASGVLIFGEQYLRNRFGVRIGLGCSKISHAAALEKALLEVLPMFSVAVLGDAPESIEAHELLGLEHPQPEHQIKWAHNPSSADSMERCLAIDSTLEPGNALDASLIVVEQIEPPSEWPSILPLIAVGARHPTAARSFFGGNQVAASFKDRLEQFSGKAFETLNRPILPHPLG